MSDKRIADIRSMAMALALSIQPVHDRPTAPPLAWAQDGDKVTVILADGRKVSATIQEINTLMFPPVVGAGLAPVHVPAKPAPVSTPSKKVVKK